jgi:hypothetical protein
VNGSRLRRRGEAQDALRAPTGDFENVGHVGPRRAAAFLHDGPNERAQADAWGAVATHWTPARTTKTLPIDPAFRKAGLCRKRGQPVGVLTTSIDGCRLRPGSRVTGPVPSRLQKSLQELGRSGGTGWDSRGTAYRLKAKGSSNPSDERRATSPTWKRPLTRVRTPSVTPSGWLLISSFDPPG